MVMHLQAVMLILMHVTDRDADESTLCGSHLALIGSRYLPPRGDVNAVEDIVGIIDDVANVNADPEVDPGPCCTTAFCAATPCT
jgi:hypothetical protein